MAIAFFGAGGQGLGRVTLLQRCGIETFCVMMRRIIYDDDDDEDNNDHNKNDKNNNDKEIMSEKLLL